MFDVSALLAFAIFHPLSSIFFGCGSAALRSLRLPADAPRHPRSAILHPLSALPPFTHHASRFPLHAPPFNQLPFNALTLPSVLSICLDLRLKEEASALRCYIQKFAQVAQNSCDRHPKSQRQRHLQLWPSSIFHPPSSLVAALPRCVFGPLRLHVNSSFRTPRSALRTLASLAPCAFTLIHHSALRAPHSALWRLWPLAPSR